VRWEALYQDTSNLESNWDGVWLGAATRDEQGWTAEMAIPFKTISFNPNNSDWGINFERTIQRNGETLGWVSRNRQMNPSVAGTASGFEGLKQGAGLDIVPSVSLREGKLYATGETTTETEPSLDVFYKLTPSLNGALTINTDFSATEMTVALGLAGRLVRLLQRDRHDMAFPYLVPGTDTKRESPKRRNSRGFPRNACFSI